MKEEIAVVGSGAWGTALANLASERGRKVVIYARQKNVLEDINHKHENIRYLKGAELSNGVSAKHIDELESSSAKHIIWAVPAQFSRAIAGKYSKALRDKNIISASKGIEISSGRFVTDVLSDETEAEFSVLSGPSFASELAGGYPTAVSIGSLSIETAKWWQQELASPYFRAYITTDITGLQVGGALKNVMALAAGICDGLNFGNNARAALLTRGLAEMTRYGVFFGASRDTFLGLSGIGDLMLTSTADESRNRTVGLAIARGKTYEEFSAGVSTVAEGVFTSKAVHLTAEKYGISMPVTTEVYRIIFEKKCVKESVRDLLLRPSDKEEQE